MLKYNKEIIVFNKDVLIQMLKVGLRTMHLMKFAIKINKFVKLDERAEFTSVGWKMSYAFIYTKSCPSIAKLI